MQLIMSVTTKGALLAGKAPEVIQKHLDQFVYQATLFAEPQVKMRTPHLTGNLSKSVDYEITGKGTPLVKGVVSTDQPYALPVETGTGIYGPKKAPFVVKAKPGKWLFWPGADHPVKQVTIKGMVGAHMFEKTFSENIEKFEAMAKKAGLEMAGELNG